MSKTNYTLDAMLSVNSDYQQTICDDCDEVKGFLEKFKAGHRPENITKQLEIKISEENKIGS